MEVGPASSVKAGRVRNGRCLSRRLGVVGGGRLVFTDVGDGAVEDSVGNAGAGVVKDCGTRPVQFEHVSNNIWCRVMSLQVLVRVWGILLAPAAAAAAAPDLCSLNGSRTTFCIYLSVCLPSPFGI